MGAFKLPTSGWLVTTESTLIESECPSHSAINLETGESHSTRDCRVTRGQGSLERGRELTLLFILGEQAKEVTGWQRIRAPDGLDLSGTCAQSAAPPPVMIKRGAHRRITYWWWSDNKVVATGTFSIGAANDLLGGFIQKRLRAAQALVARRSHPPLGLGPSDDASLNAALHALAETEPAQD